MKTQSDVMDRGQAMLLADALLKKPTFSHEDNAKVGQLLRYAELSESRFGARDTRQDSRGRKLLTALLRSYNGELRSLGVGTNTESPTIAALVKEEWYNALTNVLAAVDPFFDDNVVSTWTSATGAPAILPALDDTANSAASTSEADPDPTGDPAIFGVKLDAPSTYRSKLILVTRELSQDSAFDPVDFLSRSFALQFSRGAGPAMITELLSTAKLGRTAVGSSGNSGGSETGATSIGTSDLIALRTSVNSAYRVGDRVGWMMSDDTLSLLDSLLDKQGHPVFEQLYDSAGRRVLYGYPVFIAPNMPTVATTAKSICFGNFSYWLTRVVPPYTSVAVLQERYAESGLVGYHASLRCNGKLLGVTASDSPVKFLQQA